MTNRSNGLPLAWVRAATFAMATAVSLAGCSPDSGTDATKSSAAPGNVTLTAAQRSGIRIYTVAPSSFRKTVEVPGVVDFDNDQATSVLAPFSGPVSRLLVSPGEEVKKGQPLALVDSPDFAAAVDAYRKALVAARTARRVADFDKDLLAHKAVSEREAEQAETDAQSAEADRAASLQALVSLNVDAQTIRDVEEGRPATRGQGVIRAPIRGTLVEKLITPGELLQAGTTPCFTVADLSRVWVLAQVFGSDLASVAVGDPAEIAMDPATKVLPGKVENIAALVDPNTAAVAVRVVVGNPQRLLKKQMYVRVRIESSEETKGLLIPVSAVLRDDENLPFVYVEASDGSFARRHITPGVRTGDRYDVAEGLRPGDRIVYDGAIFVQFMQDQ
jgi:cobalt-zinc-cadmium efflux system membrane fusion protein